MKRLLLFLALYSTGKAYCSYHNVNVCENAGYELLYGMLANKPESIENGIAMLENLDSEDIKELTNSVVAGIIEVQNHPEVAPAYSSILRRLSTSGLNLSLCGYKSFYAAIIRCDENALELLIASKANIADLCKHNGETALHAATQIYPTKYKKYNRSLIVRIVQKLLEEGANPNARDRYGNTPLHSAVANSFQNYNPANTIDVLIKHSADVNALNDAMRTPLQLAARCGNIKAIKALIKNGACLNCQNNLNGEEQAIFHAELQALFAQDINGMQRFRPITSTALHLAVETGNLSVVLALLSSPKINLTLVDTTGKTALETAQDLRLRDIEKVIILYKNIQADSRFADAAKVLNAKIKSYWVKKQDCAICFESKSQIQTKCGHYYHKDCLTPWLANNSTCPTCRAAIID